MGLASLSSNSSLAITPSSIRDWGPHGEFWTVYPRQKWNPQACTSESRTLGDTSCSLAQWKTGCWEENVHQFITESPRHSDLYPWSSVKRWLQQLRHLNLDRSTENGLGMMNGSKGPWGGRSEETEEPPGEVKRKLHGQNLSEDMVRCQEEKKTLRKDRWLVFRNFRCWQDTEGEMSSRQSEIHYQHTSRKSVWKFQTKMAVEAKGKVLGNGYIQEAVSFTR